MKLYSYWRSTTSYRVRAALNLKGIPHEIVPIDLVAGDQKTPDYIALNPGAGVPALEISDGVVLTQSMAILDYLDTTFREPRLIPADPMARARVLAVAYGVAMDIHPVNNLRVIKALRSEFDASGGQQKAWMQHWMVQGFNAIQPLVNKDTPFAFGHMPDLADLCIVSQLYNAKRWDVPMDDFPMLTKIAENCLAVPAIRAAHPDNQPEAKENT